MQNEKTTRMLKEWQLNIERAEAHIAKLSDLFGNDSESPLINFLDEMVSVQTRYLAEILGDGTEWLFWYAHENCMGTSRLDVVLFGGEKLEVKSLEDLARCIESDRVQSIVERMEAVAHG